MIELLGYEALPAVENLRALGGWGALLFGVFFVLATLACFPASPLTAIAGFLYGPLWGMVLMSPIGVLSAGIAFSIARYIARPFVYRLMKKRPGLTAVDRAVANDGFRLVFLLRLSSIAPFAPLSYVLGASRIKSSDFIVASWIGLLPGTFLYVYLGSLVPDLAHLLAGNSSANHYSDWITWAGLFVAAVVLWAIARSARQAIHQSTMEEFNNE